MIPIRDNFFTKPLGSTILIINANLFVIYIAYFTKVIYQAHGAGRPPEHNMESLYLLLANLISPPVIAFAAGVIAVRVGSDLRFPEQV
jgi:hypothetical protein